MDITFTNQSKVRATWSYDKRNFGSKQDAADVTIFEDIWADADVSVIKMEKRPVQAPEIEMKCPAGALAARSPVFIDRRHVQANL